MLSRIREYTHGDRPRGSLAVQMEPRVQRGELRVSHPGDGIRKIEGLVEWDPLFRELALNSRIVDRIAQVLGPDLKLFRNALMLKPPAVGSPKGWHQDSPYWPIEPMSLSSCWIPLEDATPENGCMAVIPGGHLLGPLPHIRVTDDYVIDPDSLPGGFSGPEAGLLVPMRAGSGLFFHSLIPHYTAPNLSSGWRRAVVLAYMSSHSRYTGAGPCPTYFPIRGETFPGCIA